MINDFMDYSTEPETCITYTIEFVRHNLMRIMTTVLEWNVMIKKSIELLVAIFLTATFTLHAIADVYSEGRPIVQLANGKLEGVSSNGMRSFKNIPYAAAPIGDLRWRPPQPAKNWEGIRDASQLGQACPQPLVKGLNSELVPGREDCLKLNVYTPTDGKNLPVMVWFHGGGLIEGSASEPYYQPIGLIKQGVIVVTVDYRIGKLGFFAPKELAEEAQRNGEPVGNYGTMDQIHSLKWVRDNIAAFGGDPNNVTIFGQSAGGRTVTWLMTSPASKGLFHKAIAQSAQQLPVRDQTRKTFGMSPEEEIDAKFIKSLGVNSLAELRALPAEKLLMTPTEFRDGEFGGAFIDGQIIVGNPIPLFAADKQHKVPFMIGTNSWDASYFMISAPPIEAYLKEMGEDPQIIAKLYATFKDKCALTAEVMADGWYRGAVKLLADSANKSAPAYAYNYSYLTKNIRPMLIGAGHTFELPYVFGDLNSVLPAPSKLQSGTNQCKHIKQALADMQERGTWASYWFPMTDPNNKEDQSISEQLAKSWTAFARTGNPNYGGVETWPRYNMRDDVMREFNEGSRGTVKDLHKARVDYQLQVVKKIYGLPE
jgi:para-nitrobenzyl esterase